MVRDTAAVSEITQFNELKVIELQSDIPEALSPEILIGKVMYWRDLQEYYKKPIRIYGYCYNQLVEKYVNKLVLNYDELFVTILPGERKEMLAFD